jgi:hypothetical protein
MTVLSYWSPVFAFSLLSHCLVVVRLITFASVSFFLLSSSGHPSIFLLPVPQLVLGRLFSSRRKSDDLFDIALSLPLQDVVNTGFAILAEIRSVFSLCRIPSSFTRVTRRCILFSLPHTATYPLTLLSSPPTLSHFSYFSLPNAMFLGLTSLSLFSHFALRSTSMP